MTSDELEAARQRHPSTGGPPPAFIEAGQAVYGRRERHARHLAESSGMSIEAARAALLKGGLGPEVISEHFHDSLNGLGVWWCTTHNDNLDVCATVPLAPPWCAPVFTKAAHCAGCRVPEDQPHRPMCARVMAAGDAAGDFTPDDVLIGRLLRAAIEVEDEAGAEVGELLARGAGVGLNGNGAPTEDSVMGEVAALGLAVTGIAEEHPGYGPETALCGAQLGEALVFCTKGFFHVEAGDEVHYDHRARKTWRVAASL